MLRCSHTRPNPNPNPNPNPDLNLTLTLTQHIVMLTQQDAHFTALHIKVHETPSQQDTHLEPAHPDAHVTPTHHHTYLALLRSAKSASFERSSGTKERYLARSTWTCIKVREPQAQMYGHIVLAHTSWHGPLASASWHGPHTYASWHGPHTYASWHGPLAFTP